LAVPTQATSHPLVEAARALVPTIRASAERIEREGRLPPEIVSALSEAGVFRMLVPRSLGGGEVDPIVQMDVLEALSEADGSVGWCAAIGSGSAWALALLTPEVAAEILSDPTAIVAGNFGAPFGGRAVAVEGGYRLTGRWPFGSGSPHATWMLGHALVFDGDQPRPGPNGAPETRVMVFPKSECTILDTWHATGLAGTGSHDFAVADLLIPAERSFGLYGVTPYHDGPLYRGRFYLLAHGAHAVGIARAAIDAFVGVAASRRMPLSDALMRDRSMVQVAVAQAEALVRSGRAFLWDTTRAAWNEACATGTLSDETRALARLAISASFEQATRAVDLMYSSGGGSAVYRTNPLQRHFRDIHTASQHAIVAPPSFELIGQSLLTVAAGEAYVPPPGRPPLF
jgi:alkylation response protein AidB-like acyl-CoA dehydrogenase